MFDSKLSSKLKTMPAALLLGACLTFSATADADQEMIYSHVHCRAARTPTTGMTLNQLISFVQATGSGTVYCPFIRHSVNTIYSDADLETTGGVLGGEVSIHEYGFGGNFRATFFPVSSSNGSHDFGRIVPVGLASYLFFSISAQNNDLIYGYSVTDSEVAWDE